ncbi:MAG: Hsp20/alpha crystallin family protein [Treponema sp.]|nr:Hsp20/alpha crystallin family protein [Treponema sp.]
MRTISLFRPNTIQNSLSDFDRYFESFFGDSILSPSAAINRQIPAVDISENENSYILEMDLPGFDEKEIDVHVDGSNLSISSKQSEEKKDENTFILKERKTSTFQRSFKLPENADSQAVNASFKNGVLSLEIKKRAETQKRLIQINAA